MSSTAYKFDQLSEQIKLITADGITPAAILKDELDNWNLYNVRASISFGFQTGAFCIMFIMTAVLTRTTRRRTPVHILNLLSLALGFFRGLFQALYFTSNWNGFLAYFAQDYSEVTKHDYTLSILSIITPVLFASTVTSSLVLQAHTVTKLATQKWHFLTIFTSVLVLIIATGFRFANAFLNCRAVIHTESYFDFQWLQLSVLITETITIWFFSLIFTGKLIYTIWIRKNLGLTRWDHLQILSVMSACTMIIPSAFALVHYIDIPTFPSIDTWPLAIVALLLPLSALWASMVINDPTPGFDISRIWSNQSQTICTKCGFDPVVGKQNFHDSETSSHKAVENTIKSPCPATKAIP
ncbi:Ste2 mating-type alpha pheromone receptor [Golovinomyces cichoracearum]|uniref:Ste2 mating-type alpha pheromone receptor n=1 Tax=Golovinomyces cichoracearum TaxID=62708 RepID=A0A420IM60_9PEZI|nr:Ste2 mating-type alpha pheromone receptor [Golovinomyces cichoracearum]